MFNDRSVSRRLPNLAHHNVSALGAVMAFLYSAYIVIYAILGFLLGRVLDSEISSDDIKEGLIRVGGYVESLKTLVLNETDIY